MAQVKRSDTQYDGHPLPGRADADHRYEPGGPIGQLQADLAQRLMGSNPGQVGVLADPPGERVVRFLSSAGGYAALLAGYAVVTLAIVHWL